ncbi:MAG: site-2 protease family protein [Spirochaetales bacterium]|nr:site-2 protease family protein [Spirochaetales bacterium]
MDLETIQTILMGMTAFILAGSIHEFAHASSAYHLGDTTAKDSGRFTLNPLAHIDIFGSIFFPLLGAFSGFPVIGWMKPVPINPLNFRKPSQGQALSALAGPFSNLLQAAFLAIILKLFFVVFSAGLAEANVIILLAYRFLLTYFGINILLMIFNLLPVPPLDGGWILRHVLPGRMQQQFDRIYPYGIILLFLLVFTGGLRVLFRPFIDFIGYAPIIIITTPFWLVSIPFIVLIGITIFFFREEVKLLSHRIRHGSKFKGLKKQKAVTNVRNKKQRELIIKDGKKIREKLEQGERLDALDEISLLTIKNAQKRNVRPCTDYKFEITDQRCQKCETLPNCLFKSLENARAKVYEDV